MVSRRTLGNLAAAGLALLMLGAAQATQLYTGTMTLSSGDPIQAGRLSRNGIPQDWSGGEPYPGEINPGTSYHYQTLDLDLKVLNDALKSDLETVK